MNDASHGAPRRTIEQVVRRSDRFWKRAGVPQHRRSRMVEELREHLLDASADGRPVEDIVGPDTVAFAASWADVARDRPWAERLLSAVVILALAAGLMSFVGAAIEGRAPGLNHAALFFLGLALLSFLGGELFRALRDRMTMQQATAVGVGGVLLAAVLGGLLLPTASQDEVLLELGPGLAIALILTGLAAQALLWWLRRAPR